jgi:CHAT domain-containing protein
MNQIQKTLRTGLAVIALFSLSLAQAQYQKSIDKAEGYYDIGDYAKAAKELDKLQKTVTKKLGTKNQYIAISKIMRAKMSVKLGQLVDVETYLNDGVEMSYAVNDSVSAEHGFIMKEAAEVALEMGNMRQATKYLNASERAFKNSNNLIENIEAELNVMRVEILMGQGYYKKALDIIEKQKDFYLGRTTSGSKKELNQRKEEYATVMMVRANILRHMGDWQVSDAAFNENDLWISKNIGKKHILWSRNWFLQTEMLAENGLNNSEQVKHYEKAYEQSLKDYKPTHFMAVEALENLIFALNREGKKSETRNKLFEYGKVISSFGKNSIYVLAEKKVDFSIDLANRDFKKLENNINGMLLNPIIPKYHQERIYLYELLIELGQVSGQHRNVEEYINRILEIKAMLIGSETPEYHLSKIRLANYYVDFTDKIEDARNIYDNSFTKIVKPEINQWHKNYFDIITHMASMYEDLDDYKKSSDLLDEALLVARSKYDNKDIVYARALEKIANLQINIGQYDKAKEALDNSTSILKGFKTDDAKNLLASTLFTQAKLNVIRGEYDEAESNLKDSEKLLSKALISLDVVNLDQTNDRANLFINLGRYAEAEKILVQSLKDKRNQFGDKSRQLNAPLILNARLRLLKGDYAEAENNARRANSISTTIYGEKSTKVVPSMMALADVYINIGDYDKAETLVKSAIDILRGQFGSEHVDVGNAIAKLALIKYYNGEPTKGVLELFAQAESIIGKRLGSNNPTYAEILKNMALVNISAGNYDLANTYLLDAGKIYAAKVGKRNNVNAAAIAVLKGDILYRQKSYPAAESMYNDALKQYAKVFSNTHPEYVKVQAKLSKTYYMQSNFTKAQEQMDLVLGNYRNFIDKYFPALSEREKAKFWNTIKSNYEFYNTLIVNRNRSEKYIGELYNNALLTKALLLNSSIKIRQRILNSNDQELITMYNDWVDKKEILTTAISMSAEQLAENGINTAALTAELEALEKKMSLRSEDFAGIEKKSVTWENVRDGLRENEVAIEMVRFRFFRHDFTDSVMYAVLYVRGGKRSTPQLIILNNGKELETQYLKNYRNRIKYKLDDDVSFSQFWKPIIEKIGDGISTMYLSPDGVYNQINLEAIPTPDGKYVLDNSNIILLSNTRDLYLKKGKQAPPTVSTKALMFGNPDFYVTTKAGQPKEGSGITRANAEVISALPGTKREIEELEELLKRKGWEVEKYTEGKAEEPAIKSVSNPRIFHVATHGFFQDKKVAKNDEFNEASAYENPLLKTGLLLAGAGDILNETKFNYNVDNGILTAYEAMNLNLDQTDLVVLSACETGLGEIEAGEGVFGLQRAFLVAGARTIIMSLFKVSDEATQQLMVKFYRKWIETGNKREAFIEAKKEIRNEYKDPIYWGPFIMIGLD